DEHVDPARRALGPVPLALQPRNRAADVLLLRRGPAIVDPAEDRPRGRMAPQRACCEEALPHGMEVGLHFDGQHGFDPISIEVPAGGAVRSPAGGRRTYKYSCTAGCCLQVALYSFAIVGRRTGGGRVLLCAQRRVNLPLQYALETALPGWACEIRTQKCHR